MSVRIAPQVLAAAVVVASSTFAAAQSAPPSTDGPATVVPATPPKQGAFVPSQAAPDATGVQPFTPLPPSASVLFQRSGGSLARMQLMASPEPSQSAPAPATPTSVSFFAVPEPTPKTIHKQDLVTIVVREDSTFSSTGTTDLKKNADFDAKLDAFVQLELKSLAIKGFNPTVIPELKAEMQRDFKGEATVDRSDTLTARITARVLDVKPNGNLVLEATKRIKTDEEEQTFILTGTCRAEDLSADNTVLSTQLYDLELTKNHKGAVRDTTKRGFVPRLLDKFSPF